MKQKFIAFLDILGFKELIENNSHEKVVESYKEIFKLNYFRSFGIFLENPALDKDDAKLNSIIISDSILVWTDEANNNSFLKLIMVVKALLYSSLEAGLPLRGAIDIGELSEITIEELNVYNNRTAPVILGAGLTKAYKLESPQQWSGCIVSPECIEAFIKLSSNVTIKDLEEIGILLPYKVPLKSGKLNEFYTLNWPQTTLEKQLSNESIRASFKEHNKIIDVWDVENKIKNTIEFYNYSWTLNYKSE
jgi:hypothetical protein